MSPRRSAPSLRIAEATRGAREGVGACWLALLVACAPSSPPEAPMAPASTITVAPAAATPAPSLLNPSVEISGTDDRALDAPPPPIPAGGVAPFDRGAAVMTLASVDLVSCAKPGGPQGAGHVTVTFDPRGYAASASVDAAPFAGTSVGGCIASKFRGAKVPPFSGPPVRVGKSFTLR